MESMKQLTAEQRVRAVSALVEGNSVNSTVLMTGVTKPTILRLRGLRGEAFQVFHDDKVRGLDTKRFSAYRTTIGKAFGTDGD